MKTHYSISELAEMNLEILPRTARAIQYRADKGNWQFREVACQGGKGGVKKEYVPPPDIAAAIFAAQTERIVAQTLLPSLSGSLKSPTSQAGEKTGSSVISVSGSLANLVAQNSSGSLCPRLNAPSRAGEGVVNDEETAVSALNGSTAEQRNRMGARLGVLNAIEQLVGETQVGKEAAITTFLTMAQHPQHPHIAQMLRLANDKRGGGGDLPSPRTIKRWFKQRDEQGSLMPKVPQKSMQTPEWYARFLFYFRQPQKPSVQAAYEWFCRDYVRDEPLAKLPSVHQVRRWLDKTGEVEKQKGRMGSRELKSIQGFKRRRWQDLMPLDVVSADGQCFDAECGHPDNPNVPIRPEVTMIVDIGTRKIVGVGVDTAESGRAVRGAMIEMMTRYGIAAIFYADNGKGYTNGLLNDETTGLLGRVGMTMVHSAPYSSQARGAIERLHQTVLVKAAKRMQSYIGKDMDGEASRAVHKTTREAIKQEIALRDIPALKNIASLSPRMLPSFEEMKALIYQAVDDYNNAPHRSLARVKDISGSVRHMTPNELWAMKEMQMNAQGQFLRQVDKHEQMYLFLPQIVRTIQRCEVRVRNNIYFNQDFSEWHGHEVRVAFDEHNAERIWLFDDDGRYLGSMDWNANETDYFAKSIIDQAKDKRIDAQVSRLRTKQSVVEAARTTQKALEHQSSVNLGGIKLDMQQITEQAEAILQGEDRFRQPEKPKVLVLDKPIETPTWQVPSLDYPKQRYQEYLRLSSLKPSDLTQAQADFIHYCEHNPQGQREIEEMAYWAGDLQKIG